jgi:hypothetical protein
MSFSSTSTSALDAASSRDASSSHSSAPSSPPPPLRPDYKKFEFLMLSLIALARRAYACPSHDQRRTYVSEYTLRLHPALVRFFAKHQRNDYVADGTYGYCVQVSKLVKLIKWNLGGVRGEIEGLQVILRDGKWDMSEEEIAKMDKKICRDVDLLVFRRMELDCEKLPWNVKARKSSEKIASVMQ